MYHTQERREVRLASPVICVRHDAWLGEGYYFWLGLFDAEQWGQNSKRKTGYFEIYEARINIENFLDTVFNEEHYQFWIIQVEKAADFIMKKTGIKPSLREVNEYFKERAVWDNVDGIVFQDIPKNNNGSKVKAFFYRKRIQAVVFNPEIILTFAYYSQGRCEP